MSSADIEGFTNFESMTEKDHQKFWWINTQFSLGGKVKLGKFFIDCERCSEIGAI